MRACVTTGLILLLATVGRLANVEAAEDYTPPTTDSFLKSVRGYPFVADAARRERLRLGVPKLTRCMASPDVRKLVGDPDFGFVAYKAGTEGKVPAMVIWNYILEKKAASETEPSSRVVVWFDTQAKLQAITVHGAPDIEATVGRTSRSCT
jgi:hypothetical protein